MMFTRDEFDLFPWIVSSLLYGTSRWIPRRRRACVSVCSPVRCLRACLICPRHRTSPVYLLIPPHSTSIDLATRKCSPLPVTSSPSSTAQIGRAHV